MRSPEMSENLPVIEALRTQAERLKTQGQKMLDSTRILDALQKHGRVKEIGGSFKNGLMVHPDLDTGVVAESVDRERVTALLTDIYRNESVRFAGITDLVNFRKESKHPDARPIGYYFGIKIPFEGDMWNIDCWYQTEEWAGLAQGQTDYTDRLLLLDQAGKDAVLVLKRYLMDSGEYGVVYLSSDVYEAVLSGVRTPSEFYEYARKRNG